MEKTYNVTFKVEFNQSDFEQLADNLRECVTDYIDEIWWNDVSDEEKAKLVDSILKYTLDFITNS